MKLIFAFPRPALIAAGYLALAWSQANSQHSQNAPFDRTILPLREPEHPPITEIDVRKAVRPPRFAVKAPEGAPNVIVILLDNLGFGATSPFGGAIHMPVLERLASLKAALIGHAWAGAKVPTVRVLVSVKAGCAHDLEAEKLCQKFCYVCPRLL